MTVLVIEDDAKLGAQIVGHLLGAGFGARWLRDGQRLDAEDLHDVELVVLDLMLPTMHGFDVLSALREISAVPVLVLSARDETAQKVRGLQLGADDYMTKPFWPEEFIERVRARLRRPLMAREEGLRIGALRLDTAQRAAYVNEQPVRLTPGEYALLRALAERPGAAVTRRALVERVLDPDSPADPRTLDVHVSRLRRKLGEAVTIETVWGIGYRLANDP